METHQQKQAAQILDQSVMFADNVLKRLIAHTLGRDVNELFNSYIETKGEILITDSKHQKKYIMRLDIVDKDYMLDLGEFKGNENVKQRMIFLLNTVKVLYCPIKDHMKKWAASNGAEFNYVLQIGLNTTLFIDKNSKKRIGILLKPCP